MARERKLFNLFASLGEKIAPPFLSESKSVLGKSPNVEPEGRRLEVLFVADDIRLTDLAAKALSADGLRVHPALTIEDAMKKARDLHPALVIVDLTASNFQGLEVLRELRKLKSSMPIMAITAADNMAEMKTALASGASVVIAKRSEVDSLVEEIRLKITV